MEYIKAKEIQDLNQRATWEVSLLKTKPSFKNHTEIALIQHLQNHMNTLYKSMNTVGAPGKDVLKLDNYANALNLLLNALNN